MKGPYATAFTANTFQGIVSPLTLLTYSCFLTHAALTCDRLGGIMKKICFSVLTLFVTTFALAGSLVFPPASFAAGEGFWSTSGNRIVDANGNTVKIAGVSWFGMETGTFAPHGLWSRGYREMMDQMKSLGYNTIRLPYSNESLHAKPNGIDYGKNSDLKNLSSLEVMDKIVDYAGATGMKILLDRHRPDAGGQSSLWYTDAYPESRWIDDWKMLAKRYRNNPAVIGADIHNEPHDNACWGCGDRALDWKEAATRAGNAILSVNPDWLIVVQGVQVHDNQYYWWGGNLRGVRTNPLSLNVAGRVVYSIHDYPNSVSPQSWFKDPNYPNNLEGVWDATWGYVHKENIAPVLIGEFGSKLETEEDRKWFQSLISYLKTNDMPWVFWSWNPNSGDTNGLLKDDWNTVDDRKQQLLSTIQGMSFSPQNLPSPTPAAASPTPSSAPRITPHATPTPSITVYGNAVSVWWPSNTNAVSGVQPFKAVLEGRNVESYDMYWQVDGGALNRMESSYQDYPHKEASVDLSGWNWKGSGPYEVRFVTRDSNGEIASSTVSVTVR